jgi:hypothetical protein
MQDDSAGGPEVERSPSEQTWRTWRDVNDSYAYSDVRKYIKDNELMGSEKEEWIAMFVPKEISLLPVHPRNRLASNGLPVY